MQNNLPLSFQNQYGLISPSGRFPPFGPLVLVGDWFSLTSGNFSRADSTNLVIRLCWSGLPESFVSYYHGYSISPLVDNSCFKVDFYLLEVGSPRLLNEQPLDLFAADEKGVLAPERVFKLKIDPTWLAACGFRIRMVLVGPACGFGSRSYPEAVAASALATAQEKRTLAIQPPFVPLLSAVEVSWEASSADCRNPQTILF